MAGRQGSLGSTKEQLASVFKLIKEAQTLDGNGDELVRFKMSFGLKKYEREIKNRAYEILTHQNWITLYSNVHKHRITVRDIVIHSYIFCTGSVQTLFGCCCIYSTDSEQ